MIQSFFRRAYWHFAVKYFRAQYMKTARTVLKTPVLPKGSMPFILVSMVQQRDVYSYLVAVKSFAIYTNPTRIVVVCDPSITEVDRAIFRQHIPHIELRNAIEFVNSYIPRGGCWERLYAISGYSSEGYVVQLDADTVTLQSNEFVRDSILNKKGFVLGELRNQKLLQLDDAGAMARHKMVQEAGMPVHIQVLAESVMDTLGLHENMRYVRGCAGFTGFPLDVKMREKLLLFSKTMGAHFGKRWHDWGTEQITSNYLVASCPGTAVLPFPAYGTPDVADSNTVFLHFIGSMRFINGHYQRATRKIVDQLRHR
jgi:hypothetical protein